MMAVRSASFESLRWRRPPPRVRAKTSGAWVRSRSYLQQGRAFSNKCYRPPLELNPNFVPSTTAQHYLS
jgi:hypothetical protein